MLNEVFKKNIGFVLFIIMFIAFTLVASWRIEKLDNINEIDSELVYNR